MVVMTLASVFLASPVAAQETSLDEILSRYYEAIGGLEAWKAVRSIRVVGTTRLVQSGREVHVIALMKRPGMSRVEQSRAGMTAISGFDGKTAWSLSAFVSASPERLEGARLERMRENADLDGVLVGYEEDGHRVELIRMAEVEGERAYELKVTLASGDIQFYYLDAKSFLPTKIKYTTVVGSNRVDVESFIDDYRDVGGGLLMAHLVDSKVSDPNHNMVAFIEKVELNVELDDSIFKVPGTGPGGREH
jgi:outer membrane lipoprotein-sorting protein